MRTFGAYDEADGVALTSLDIGLPIDPIKPLIGKDIKVRVTCTGFRNTDGAVNGALLLLEVLH